MQAYMDYNLIYKYKKIKAISVILPSSECPFAG